MRCLALILSGIVFLGFGALPVSAATFTVNSTVDAVDAAVGNGVCETAPGNGVCTLRAAIQETNGLPGADEIILPAGTYTLAIPGPDEDAAATGDLDIRDDLTITGAGAAVTIIDGGGLDWVFHVYPRYWVGEQTVIISGVTTQQGVGGILHQASDWISTLNVIDSVVQDNADSGIANVGSPYNLLGRGLLTVTRSTVSGNAASGIVQHRCPQELTVIDSTISGNTTMSTGGGILVGCGTASITNSIISNNTADGGGGGGIRMDGQMVLTDSTVSNNTSRFAGGGVLLRGRADVARSTISGNTGGGGIVLDSFGGVLNLTNSTVSGNVRTSNGGGIAIDLADQPNTVNLNNVTITNNTAGGAGGGISSPFLHGPGSGPGLAVFNIRNTIIAGNTDQSAVGPDCSGPLITFVHNLIQNPTGCSVLGDITGTVFGLDPRIGPLADNGGLTLTHGLLAGSPAIDAGDNATCEATDQRGVTRPVGAACDIGAFEGVLEGLTILTQSPLLNQIGVFSSDAFEATGGLPPYAWSVIDGALPAGMNFSVDGILSGTPTQIGSFTFTVRVTDSANTAAEKTFVEEVSLTPPPQVRINKFGTAAVAGREIDYFILLENIGNVTATDHQVIEFLEPWFSFVSADPAPLSVEVSVEGGGTVLWNAPPLAPGDFRVFSYKARLDPFAPLGASVHGGPVCHIPTFLRSEEEAALRTCADRFREGPEVVEECAYELFPDIRSCKLATYIIVRARDPNEKGAIAPTFIRPDQTLVYPIHFENIGDIEARDVFVTDVLDSNLDASTVQIVTPDGTFNAATRTVRWDLLGINLPAGQSDNVLLAVKPLPGLPSGTAIRNSANIQFEVFETITTNEVVNIIDTTPPTCTMNPLPSATGTPSFPISWSGTDAIGEIDSYTILVSVDGGGFTSLLNTTIAANVTFTGETGRTYGFICVATDTARNVEVQSLIAEANTTIGANFPPVAQCQNVTVSADASCQGSASVNNGSSDPDGDLLTLVQSPAGPYSLGSTPVTLTVTDAVGASASCQATVMVVDQTPPVIQSMAASPNVLWPPNHQMVPVNVALSASDRCDLVPSCRITSVSSNEPVSGAGAGNTAPDWEITGNLAVNLRAERSGKGTGRVYTIAAMCTDASGNSSTKTATVTVPHDQGKK
jgi:CSLREA domain-containing protein/uncharacterized repeat protein (TIGR01451 family)